MEESFAIPEQRDSDHWLNGFLKQNCEEARRRVQEERNLWNLTTNENDDLDLSGIFNFNNYENPNEYNGEDISPTNATDSVDETETRTASFDDRVSIHEFERQTKHEDILRSSSSHEGSSGYNDKLSDHDRWPSPDDLQNYSAIHDQATTSCAGGQCLSYTPLVERRTSRSLSDGYKQPDACAGDLGHVPSADNVVSQSTVADWGFETELVEVASIGIVHAKQQLQRAINDFNSDIVKRERVCFQLKMKQIEETVNEVLDEVERLDRNFKLRRMGPESYYELKSRNEVDILIVFDLSPNEFVIEDMKTPTGYARIRMKPSQITSLSNTTSSDMTSSHFQLFQWCEETQLGELYLSPKKLCKAFAALVSRAAGKIARNGSSVNRKRVSFSNSDKEASILFTVNLIPTVECPQTWPLCAYWLRSYPKKWPAEGMRDGVIRGGMHLVALVTSKESDFLWRISFCAARRHLMKFDCEGKKKCLRILKVLLSKELSRPKGLVPLHLENIVLWASRKHWQEEEWAEYVLSERILEILVALHKCLDNNDCYNFFVPTMNLFSELRPDVLKMLAVKVKDVLHDPFKYLK